MEHEITHAVLHAIGRLIGDRPMTDSLRNDIIAGLTVALLELAGDRKIIVLVDGEPA